MGFLATDFDRNTSEFSGGWRMRIELAKILLKKPDLILLDEPTNHMDIESIQWLEDFLINQAKAVMVISHDKAFVDNITNRTIEVTMGRIYDYKVNYSQYHKGKYLVAWNPKSSTENERHSVVLSNDRIVILVKQIAGAVAKRIVNYLQPGQKVEQGGELGFIKFGSRVDLLLPPGTKINVKLNEKVQAGVTVLAEY